MFFCIGNRFRFLTYSNESVVSEEAVRRYLMRKPMTAKELLQKFKKSKTNLSSEQLVNTMTQILKRINPSRRMVGGQMQLSLMPENSKVSTFVRLFLHNDVIE
jgi:transcription initiation factor TFIIF subunit alpha